METMPLTNLKVSIAGDLPENERRGVKEFYDRDGHVVIDGKLGIHCDGAIRY